MVVVVVVVPVPYSYDDLSSSRFLLSARPSQCFPNLTRLTLYLVRKLVWIIRKLEESRAFIPPKPHRLFLVGELTEPRTAIASHIAWTPEPVGTVWGTVYTAQATCA